MARVDDLIRAKLGSDVVLINQLGAHIVAGGGKRLRPAVVLLAARAANCDGDAHVSLAAIVEFIHTATLLHDDVVDRSDLRRGRESANAVFGNEASVLTGDFLYSRAFQMMVEVGKMRVMEILADTTNRIAEGEVLQLMNCHDPDVTEARYLEVVARKTAELFEAGARVGAVISDASEEIEQALATYGHHLGMAFQLVDDLLDFQGDAAVIGKNLGDDLAEGKPTLPVIEAIRSGTAEQAEMLREAIRNGGSARLESVVPAIESAGGIAYTAALARREATQAKVALEPLPASEFREALISVADFSVQRAS